MSTINDLKYQLKGQMGEEVTFIGFPTAEGNGSVIMMSSNAFAISAKSAYKDGAWEFVRHYLTEDYQKSGEFYDFPIVKSVFEEKAKEATGKSYWINENGEKVEYDDYYYIGGEEIILEPFTQEEVDAICEFIYSVKKVNKFDNNIRNIINEEAQSFFEGQKSAQEVAQIIQSRAQIFVDENR
jgi:ABC-type glycerol-3-phosphate transport system substrate-binding protein